jgi:hypothetical protein
MKINWDKKTWIWFAVVALINYANILAIILLDLNVFQMVITTTISIIIILALFRILYKHGHLTPTIKNDGNRS